MNKKVIWGNAYAYYHAFSILYEKFNNAAKVTTPEEEETLKQKDLMLFFPVATNLAFACELFLKSMLPDGTHGHNLRELFSQLDNNLQNAIKKFTISTMQKRDKKKVYSNADFVNYISNNEMSFVEWRYFYENNAKTFNLEFMKCFCEALLEISTRLVP